MKRLVPALLLMVGACVRPADTAAPVAVSAPPPPAPPADAAPLPSAIPLEGRLEQGGVAFGTAPAGTVSLRLGNEEVALAADRRFVLGFDRDAPAVLVLEARFADGRTLAQPLTIARRAWALEQVDVPKQAGVTNAEFERRRAPEVARINAARAISSATQGWRQSFAWPAHGRISGVFGSQRIYRGGEPGAYHSGVDIAGGAGAPVTAPADGVVVLAADAPFTLEGNLLIIDHGMGLNSAFLHLSKIEVRAGDRVSKGQRVGAIGSSGRATGPHLHWAVKWRGARVDPAILAGPR